MRESVLQSIELQSVVFLFSISNAFSKMASQSQIGSLRFFLFYGMSLLLLGIYALVWQQILRKIPLSIAYVHKAAGLVWGMVWGILLFQEEIKPGKLAGTLLAMLGIWVFSRGGKQHECSCV